MTISFSTSIGAATIRERCAIEQIRYLYHSLVHYNWLIENRITLVINNTAEFMAIELQCCWIIISVHIFQGCHRNDPPSCPTANNMAPFPFYIFVLCMCRRFKNVMTELTVCISVLRESMVSLSSVIFALSSEVYIDNGRPPIVVFACLGRPVRSTSPLGFM